MGRHKPYQRCWLLRIYSERIRTVRIQPSENILWTAELGNRSILCRCAAWWPYLLWWTCGNLHGQQHHRPCKLTEDRYQDFFTGQLSNHRSNQKNILILIQRRTPAGSVIWVGHCQRAFFFVWYKKVVCRTSCRIRHGESASCHGNDFEKGQSAQKIKCQ